jgi:large subunit ribosomal protein L47
MSLFRTAFTQLRPRLTRTVEEFYDAATKKGEKPFTGRSWRASELRLKSFQDLHKLWFVLLKEKNMLLGQRLEAQVTKERDAFPHPHRLVKVKKSMARIKRVLSEREQIVEQARQYVKEMYAKQQRPSS